MKISIGSKIVKGPWGGGNLFAINLSNYLIENGHTVKYDLTHSDIDVILLTDPRSRRESSSTFNHEDIENYKKYVNPNVVVVQRINECDERKGTQNINNFYLNASNVADHVVFVSSWLRDIYLDIGMEVYKTSVILAGANKDIFNPIKGTHWDGKSPLKLVTHHWSSHENKGFKIYKEIDNLIKDANWKNKLEFTYIGNMNSNYIFENSKVIKPLAGLDLAKELKKHHIYITASVNEPSGNHHIEAAQCNLPIIYINSGGVPEYCEGYGWEMSESIEETIKQSIKEYNLLKNSLLSYPFNSQKMCQEFLNLFYNLVEKKDTLDTKPLKLKGMKVIIKSYFQKFLRANFLSSIKNKIIKLFK